MAGGSVMGHFFFIAFVALAIPWTVFLYSEFSFDDTSHAKSPPCTG